MARAEFARDAGIFRQRQKDRRGGDAFALNNDRAVVQRRGRIKNRNEQIITATRVERHARINQISQTDVALDDDQRAGFFPKPASSPPKRFRRKSSRRY